MIPIFNRKNLKTCIILKYDAKKNKTANRTLYAASPLVTTPPSKDEVGNPKVFNLLVVKLERPEF
jgi:hypothetical protein